MLNLREDDYVNENSETDLIPEIYLLFTNNFLKLFEDIIKLLEKNNTTCVDLRVFSVMDMLLTKLIQRKGRNKCSLESIKADLLIKLITRERISSFYAFCGGYK
jgi:hypothetical protein